MSLHESFLVHRNFKYLIVAVVLVIVAAISFVFYDPLEPHNGGTIYGYTIGTICAVIVLILLSLGIRKRQYKSTLGTVKGWLSAHVYLGIALVFLASLHSNLQFGINIHTVTFLLMCMVVLSGLIGVYFYYKYPLLITQSQANNSNSQLNSKLAELDSEAIRLADKLDNVYTPLLVSAIERTEIVEKAGFGSQWIDNSKIYISEILASEKFQPGLQGNANQDTLIDILNERLSKSKGGDEVVYLQNLIRIISTRKRVITQLKETAIMQSKMRHWLKFHIPLSFALLGSLIAHVFAVFTYW